MSDICPRSPATALSSMQCTKTHLYLDVSRMMHSVTALPFTSMFNVKQMQESLSVTVASYISSNRMVKVKALGICSTAMHISVKIGRYSPFLIFRLYGGVVSMKVSFEDIPQPPHNHHHHHPVAPTPTHLNTNSSNEVQQLNQSLAWVQLLSPKMS